MDESTNEQPSTTPDRATAIEAKLNQAEAAEPAAPPVKPAEPASDVEKMVPLKALQEERAEKKYLREERDRLLAERRELLEGRSKGRQEVEPADEVDSFLEANADDPVIKAVERADEKASAAAEYIEEIKSRDANRWIDDRTRELGEKYKGLPGVFDDKGAPSERFKEFFTWVTDRSDAWRSEKDFNADFVSYFSEEIIKQREERAVAEAMKRKSDAGRAATIVAPPGKAGGTPTAFARYDDRQKRILERLNAQGS